MDNAQAALYFHTIFREAENAWAFIHENKYEPDTYDDPANNPTKFKKYIYDDDTKDVTINYNAWVTNHLLLVGTIRVKFAKDSYQNNGAKANVFLTDFSINGQDVRGEPTITRNNDNKYSFIFVDGAIYETGASGLLISGSIESGQYERIEGGGTQSQDDDVWAYSGTMKGMLHEEPKLTYTNKVLTSYVDENGENGIIHFTMSSKCNTARKGVSQITIPGREDIIYGYFCSEIIFLSVTNIH